MGRRLLLEYRIAGNFQGRKLARIGERFNFHGAKFRGLLTFAAPSMVSLVPGAEEEHLVHTDALPVN